MSIMIPILITGGTQETRWQKATELYCATRDTRHATRKRKFQIQDTKYKILNTKYQSDPDLILFDSPTAIGIDKVRNLQKRLSLKPFGPGPTTAIINNAQNLTIQAQNAFLKTLEEPPKNSQIILTAPTIESLLPTVISRCQIIELSQKPQISLTEKEISQFERSEIKLRLFLNFLISLVHSSIGERLKKIDELNLFKDRQKAIEWVDTQTVVIRKMLFNSLTSSPFIPSLPSLPSTSQLLTILKSLNLTKKYLQANVNIRLALDNFLLDLPKRKC